jgi:tetratricopeptide (TPR) repeat protein
MQLPSRPAGDLAAGAPVSAWDEAVVLPTYAPGPADPNPMFFTKRVYQGSSGRVYPNTFTDQISDTKVDRAWQAVHLANEYVRVMILPELGGRIHVGQDLTNGYDFFYRQDVIKPALIGLLGPWVSGGVEFNWPQHHRPSTFMPVDWSIEVEPDGSKTVWLSEHDPLFRMKGMVGIRVRPGSAMVEARVRLYNRTPYTQTFLWWANAAVAVHDRYQTFFPPDVTRVADHARRAVTSFPIARGRYYGADYGARPSEDADLRWYRNIPVLTSYMVVDSDFDFFGGYDHAAEAGVVHLADHRVAPGKKQFTWGCGEFGRAWDRELCDDGRPYVELMAGAYTDNQPDFSFLAPFETRTFSQAWYPIQKTGPVDLANSDLAVSLRVDGPNLAVAASPSSRFDGASVRVTSGDRAILEWTGDIAPGLPFARTVPLPTAVDPATLELTVTASNGRLLIRHVPPPAPRSSTLEPATEPPLPKDIESQEELFLTGLHLDQYRHATRDPEAYWREALRRDPGDARCNAAMAARCLLRAEAVDAEQHARRAIGRLTRRNANPRDGEPHYLLGLALRLQGRHDEARDAFAKATWNDAWQRPAHLALAELASYRRDWTAALVHVDRALAVGVDCLAARNLRAAVLRQLGRYDEALSLARGTLDMDPLDARAAAECALAEGADLRLSFDPRVHLDIAHEYVQAGLLDDAVSVLRAALQPGEPMDGTAPILHYTLGRLLERIGDGLAARRERSLGRAADPTYCFPGRIEELDILQAAIADDPTDARAWYYLGNLLYGWKRHKEGIRSWQRAAALDPAFPTVHRNLGIGWFNGGQPDKARAAYRRAVKAAPDDPRILYESDQVEKRTNCPVEDRLALLERRRDVVVLRDDLSMEFATLLNLAGRHEDALAFVLGQRFHPWEGGEGKVSGQYVEAHLRLADQALESGDPARALAHAESARTYPANIGEGKSLLEDEHGVFRRIGLAKRALGDEAGAMTAFEAAARLPGTTSEAVYEAALALRETGQERAATSALKALLRDARALARREVRHDYFATKLPELLIFEDDVDARHKVECLYLEGLALAGLGRMAAARAALRRVVAIDAGHQGALTALGSSHAKVARRDSREK